MTNLPSEARRRLSASIGPAEGRTVHIPAIPLTARGWASVLEDAGLNLDGDFANALKAAHVAAKSEDPTTIREATRWLAAATDQVLADLFLIEAFKPSSDGRAAHARTLIRQIANDALEAVVNRDVADQDRQHRVLAELLDSMAREPEIVDDQLQAVFGASRSELVDSDERISVDRIIAALHRQGRLGLDVTGAILAPLTTVQPPGYVRIRTVLPLLTSTRPLLTLRTADRVKSMILRRAAIELADTSDVLRKHKLGIERSAASHRGMMRVQASLASADTPSEVAYLTLDLYRRFIEGQVRPWAWVLLRLAGATSRDTPAELGTMAPQLRASRDPILNAWAEPILPSVRNAAAHEDFTWDHEASALRVGADLVEVSELERAIERGYSMMIGAECGLACARASSRALGAALDAPDRPGESRTISLAAALSRFGTNGLHVRSSRWEGSQVVVELDRLDEPAINPCFQAVIESIEWVAPETFEIRVSGQAKPVALLKADAVHASREIWLAALLSFQEMPTSVFVPLNVEVRLDVEDLATATGAAAWLALDSALAVHRSYNWSIPRHAELVARGLELARRSSELVLRRVPAVDADPFSSAVRLIRDAEAAARARAAGIVLYKPAESIHQVQAAFEALQRPRILPTLEE